MSVIEALKRSDYQLLEELGRGKFGTITKCYSSTKNQFFACKAIDKSLLKDTTDRECLENEPKIMTLLSSHPNVVQIVDVFDTDELLVIIMELCETHTLYDRMVQRVVFTEPEAALIMKQLLQAISHCHKYGVVHRDVKPENIFFALHNNTNENDENNTKNTNIFSDTLKLGDFGSATWVGDNGKALGVVGTPYYVAPEVLAGKEYYNEKVDVWSAGVVLYIMLGGVAPFCGPSTSEVFAAVLRANLRFPLKSFRAVSASAKDLLRKMICRDVTRRLSADQALRHPWILSGGETVHPN